jgi:hypothetical protein
MENENDETPKNLRYLAAMLKIIGILISIKLLIDLINFIRKT